MLDTSWPAFFTTSLTSFALIAAAEIGDKSQLVCMTLASRHRPWPVFAGAVMAFALLNALAVALGGVIAERLPAHWLAAMVALLFAGFGLHALLWHEDGGAGEVSGKTGRGIFLATLLLITAAEFGDKTQLAVVALSSTASVLAVWLGSTLALSGLALLAVVAGRTVLKHLPLVLLHRISGIIFLILAALMGYRAYTVIALQMPVF